MAKVKQPRWGWALTGSGHFFKECLDIIGELDEVDLFVTRAAGEVIRMYRQALPKSMRVIRDTTASAVSLTSDPQRNSPADGIRTTLMVAPQQSEPPGSPRLGSMGRCNSAGG